MVSLGKEYNQIVNLTKFNVNFSKYVDSCDILKQSPDYILEKYNHWIGFEPIVEHKIYTPDDMTDFFNKYWKIWRPSSIALQMSSFKEVFFNTEKDMLSGS